MPDESSELLKEGGDWGPLFFSGIDVDNDGGDGGRAAVFPSPEVCADLPGVRPVVPTGATLFAPHRCALEGTMDQLDVVVGVHFPSVVDGLPIEVVTGGGGGGADIS